MLSEQEIYEKKNPLCILCQQRFPLAGMNSRFGGGRIEKGVPMCSRCERDGGRNVIARYQNPRTGTVHIGDGERQKIYREKVVSGPRTFKRS